MKGLLKAGDWVEVRSKKEIVATLDADGRLDSMPFMPEMLQFCGGKFQVQKRAHKSCDYTTPYPYGSRSLEQTVLLDTRCDGSAHGGCQAGCTILWKDAWLKPASDTVTIRRRAAVSPDVAAPNAPACSEVTLWSRTQLKNESPVKYVCQMTELPKASRPLAWWDVRQYIEDLSSGNVTLRRLITGTVYATYYNISNAGIGVGPTMRWLYNALRWVWRGSLFPRTPGRLGAGTPTPTASLNLQPGELVRVKAHEDILDTVTSQNINRGMYWDAELVPYCGGTYRVLRRVSKIIDEKSGTMVEMKTPCIVLDSVVCEARYSPCRMFCPRAMYPYWREVWLERVEENAGRPSGTVVAKS